MKITRRTFVKQSAAAAAAAVAGIPLPGAAQSVVTDASLTRLKWSKAPCRFCGTGCGVNVAVKDGRVVATHGDMNSEVNRGLNCVKGYFLSKIMYGEDRLTTPLLRMKDGKYDKNGEFAPVSWDRAFDEMAAQWKRVLKEKGPTAVGMFGSGQWTVFLDYYQRRDPSVLGKRGSDIEGIGRPRVEPSFVPDVIDRMIQVPNTASYAAMRVLDRLVGRKYGGSTGTDFWGAMRIACEMHAAGETGAIVTLACDPGDRYLDTYYSDAWLEANGYDIGPHTAQIERALRGEGWQEA